MSLEKREVIGNSPGLNSPSDQFLIRKAVRERWPITPEMREKVLVQVEDVLDNPKSEDSLKLTAARTIVSIDALNLKEKELVIRSQPKHIIHTNMSTEELIQRVKELSQELGVAMPKAALECLNESGRTD